MLITTGDRETPAVLERAQNLAALTGATRVPRGRTSLAKLAERYGDGDILVVMEQGVRLHRAGQEPLTFHPSMGFVRAKRLLKGESDAMLEAARAAPGDFVIDGTAGLGSDASVFAVAAGPGGRVLALEDSFPLWALLQEGLKHYVSGLPEFDAALRRIETVHGNHLEVLRGMPDKSADIVYFDPMFRHPLEDSSSISPLRTFANAGSLSAEAVREACRVARKTVVMKEQKGSGEFARLGFETSARAHTKIAYGVIALDHK
ncbi:MULTISPECIES: class I SAM-dependent methyltransferase [Paenibacillus]|uniref:class I SAM-dependent methyltransferase n=1 Tax=Paenibacillus TaxID=44249 RepID=UPI002DBA10B4|nr:class I SAM-dependent methyltransferase [Paenibacillus macerans]MEC0330712.1 class I SAM-dependent methyltransferase [Paenibacillus macerans]